MSTRTAKYPLTDFHAFLRSTGITERSAQQYMTSIRRLLARVEPEHMRNVDDLAIYLASMPAPTRLLFRTAWSRFRAYAETLGDSLPEIPRLPRERLPHPLWADTTDLTAAYPAEAIHLLRWPAVRADPLLHAAAVRFFQYITGRSPSDNDIVIPWHADATEAMPGWMLMAILGTYSGLGMLGQKAAIFLEVTTRAGIEGNQLREIWSKLEHLKTSQKGRRRMLTALNSLPDDAENGFQWSDAVHRDFLMRLEVDAAKGRTEIVNYAEKHDTSGRWPIPMIPFRHG